MTGRDQDGVPHAPLVVVLAADAGRAEVSGVVGLLAELGCPATSARGAGRVLVGTSGAGTLTAAELDRLGGLSGVRDVRTAPVGHRLVSRAAVPERSTVDVSGVPIGPGSVTLIAGPCAVESPEQTLAAARMAQLAGATLLRGGAFKPRTSPYAFQGLGERGLQILGEVGRELGLPTVTEVVDAGDVDLVAEHADMIQIGTRNMQNFALLQAVARVGRPVLIKRGMTATIEEWLSAAEYVARAGQLAIVLCERGIRTFETATRNTLDVSAVPVAQALSHLPVIVDPSHSGGRRDLVVPLSRAAVAVGADGVIVDVHPEPGLALCDGPQALVAEDLPALADAVHGLAGFLGRATPTPLRIVA